jgi:hypothetical protein
MRGVWGSVSRGEEDGMAADEDEVRSAMREER